jgi:hypothetical protein
MSPPSNADVATTFVVSNDPRRVSRAESSPPRMAIHILELRNAINEARIDSDINVPAIAFSDPAIEPGDLIRAVHLQELRGGVR